MFDSVNGNGGFIHHLEDEGAPCQCRSLSPGLSAVRSQWL